MKKFLSLAMALLLVVGLVPAFVSSVKADDEMKKIYPIGENPVMDGVLSEWGEPTETVESENYGTVDFYFAYDETYIYVVARAEKNAGAAYAFLQVRGQIKDDGTAADVCWFGYLPQIYAWPNHPMNEDWGCTKSGDYYVLEARIERSNFTYGEDGDTIMMLACCEVDAAPQEAKVHSNGSVASNSDWKGLVEYALVGAETETEAVETETEAVETETEAVETETEAVETETEAVETETEAVETETEAVETETEAVETETEAVETETEAVETEDTTDDNDAPATFDAFVAVAVIAAASAAGIVVSKKRR